MKALILNGSEILRDMAAAVESALAAELSARGYVVATRELASLSVPDCKGDFGCWTVTPGVCVHSGPHRDVARDLVQSDLVVWLSPVTFGGYSSALKRQLDHCIPLISPWFTTVEGETHHQPRYERFPDVLAVGLVERRRDEEVGVFERLVRRNALNMHTRHFLSPVVSRDEVRDVGARATTWLDDLASSPAARPGGEPLDLSPRGDLPAEKPGRAVLLVGSPRGSASVSASLAEHFGRALSERGLRVVTEPIGASDPHRDPGVLDSPALRQADLLALVAPLYVDSLPAPVTAFLEALARQRADTPPSRARLLAIVNCGFPEAVHNDTALAICRQFAEQASLDWIGGLGLGAGGMYAGRPLAELGGRAKDLTRALTLAADAVAGGQVVPEEARRLVAKLPIPRWLYRFFGDWGFRQEAKKHRALSRIGARPYAA